MGILSQESMKLAICSFQNKLQSGKYQYYLLSHRIPKLAEIKTKKVEGKYLWKEK